MNATALAACLLLAASTCLAAPAVLFDFESDADLHAWHREGQPVGTPVGEISRAEQGAASGSWSMRVQSPAWKPGMPEWPAWECQPPITDWAGYDRLVFDATNVTATTQKLCLFVSDSAHATRDGYLHAQELAPFSHVLATVPLDKVAAKGIGLASIRVLHMFTERPPSDMDVYVDRMALLRAGDALPDLPPAYLAALVPFRTREVSALRDLVAEARARLARDAESVPAARAAVETALRELETQVSQFADRVSRADRETITTEGPRAAIEARLGRLEPTTQLRTRFEPVRKAVSVRGADRGDVVVGFATSMEKVLPRAAAPGLTVGAAVHVDLARNEKEALQVIVLPCERDLRQVEVRVGDLLGADGTRLSAGNVQTCTVGYAETKAVPPYGSSHVGWWPDPILEFQRSADIAVGDAQAFWVRVRAPKGQAPGTYRGKLSIVADGATAFRFDLTVRVRAFTLPDRPPLDLAITFSPAYLHADASGGGEYQDERWESHRAEWADMLADHYMTPDNLYGGAAWSPDFENLERLHREGRLARFNLGYYGACGETEAEIAAWRAATIDAIRPRYEKAKQLGILDHAYIYGCDENPEDRFPGVERAAKLLKQAFPEVFVLTTTYDHSFGLESVIHSVDGFCPLTPSFDAARAAKARAAGKQVWWYICCGPHHPYANMFVEYPAIEGRLLTGAMTAKYRPDGFLYYQTSIWNAPPIDSGPFTKWDPRSWTTYHGDGSWTCPGPDGTPLPTIRLENFRDGLEDYAYYRILEATVAKVEADANLRAKSARWLARAKAALAVPEDLVKSMTEYTHDPAAVYRYREALADVIEAAPMKAAEL